MQVYTQRLSNWHRKGEIFHHKFRLLLPGKTIWLYTGYQWEQIFNGGVYTSKEHAGLKRRNIVKQCNVLIDGRYIDSQRDVTLHWCGSSNQRIISVQESLKQNKIILYDNQKRGEL